MKVFKFGGASVKDAPAFRNILTILNEYKDADLFIVISAMGKMTNAFEKLLEDYFNRLHYEDHLNQIKKYHFDIVNELFADINNDIINHIQTIFKSLEDNLNKPSSKNYNFEYDRIVSYGELISSTILSHFLNAHNLKNVLIDARDVIKTDATYREARVDWGNTSALIADAYRKVLAKDCKIAVTQGFIGASPHGFTTTLGREGSDFTAAILGYSLKAEEVVIWKDVPGVLNADPKQFDETQKIDYLTYLDAIELSYYGATVIHPQTIKPLENTNIPLLVKSFINSKGEGTVISNRCPKVKPIPSFIFKFNQILISIQPKDFSFIVERNISAIFMMLARYNIKVNLMQNSAVSFSICTDYDSFKTPQLLEELKKDFKIYYNQNLDLVTIRHYNDETIMKVCKDKEMILEQKSRNTAQMILKKKSA